MSLIANQITTRGLILQGTVTAAGLAIAQALLSLFDIQLSMSARLGKVLVAIAVLITVILIVRFFLRDPIKATDRMPALALQLPAPIVIKTPTHTSSKLT